MHARFGPFTFDSTSRELRQGKTPVHISTKAFDLLQQLLETTPQVVAKREILDRIWRDVFISDGTLAAVVAELRRSLGDDARQQKFIRTVHRVGYSFCGAISAPAISGTALAYRLRWGGRDIHLGDGANILGRDRTAIVWIDDPSISRRHALIEVSDASVTIEDLGSKNGTFIRGRRVEGRQVIVDGDAVTFGRVPMTFRIFRQGVPTE